jgi:Secretion system C-terminal sorting domain
MDLPGLSCLTLKDPVLYNSIATSCTVTGLEELPEGYIPVNVYPNPTSAFLNIQTPVALNLKLEVFDLFGNVVKAETISNSKMSQISIIDLSDGLYLLRLYLGTDSIKSMKIAIVK